jgi:5'-3' exonuclease
MGIPSYFSHIVKKHRNIFKKVSKETTKIDNLYLDCNSIIYDAVHELQKDKNAHGQKEHSKINNFSTFEKLLIKMVCEKLDYYLQLLEPSQRVLIAFDGVAPVAKLDQQRKRRYMSWYNEKIVAELKKEKSDSTTWSTSSITPGTEFMEQLTSNIKLHFQSNKNNINIMISASDEVGEGEHKIYDYIRKNSEYHSKTTTVIYGLDADLIMLTLNHLHISNKMYLFRETPHFIQGIDKTLDPNELYLMDIPYFAERMIEELSEAGTSEAETSKAETSKAERKDLTNNKIFDYIFICFFLGNDFMPHFPALNIRTSGIDTLICAYKHVFSGSKTGIIENNASEGQNIIWKNLRKFIDYLNSTELESIKNEYIRRDKQAKNMLSYYDSKKDDEKLLLIPLKDRSIEKFINPYESGWQERYYNALFNIRINDDRRKEICLNYLEGLEWTMKYYSKGCVDWRWSYKYDYPPLLCDLIKYVPYFDTTLLEVKPKNPVIPLVQLSYVLPKSSHYLLPANIRALLKAEWYNDDCSFKWSFCKYFWEAHVCLPEISISELEILIK